LNQLDIHEILKRLPHRFPFILVDRVLDYAKDQSITAIKNVTINEPFFPGHFPNRPIMPGVLLLEAMAQSCAILSFVSMDMVPEKNSIVYFVGADKARFKRPVEPGDQVRFESSIKRRMKGVWFFESSAYVDDKLCASAEIMCTYREI
jgi:3-hydroxyacyl-[acyl-carrier-protein] dehydratase